MFQVAGGGGQGLGPEFGAGDGGVEGQDRGGAESPDPVDGDLKRKLLGG